MYDDATIIEVLDSIWRDDLVESANRFIQHRRLVVPRQIDAHRFV
jgi:hypothetical protein